MDLALSYSRDLDAYDLKIDPARADFVQEESLVTAALLSLLTDRLAQKNDVPVGADRRGWWADTFGLDGDLFGSRLWLLAREKQLPDTLQRVRAYIEEALAWLVQDEFASGLTVTVFSPRRGWVVAEVEVALRGDARRYRFEWDDAAQVWRLAGERT
jgi:phage gp46-like protein